MNTVLKRVSGRIIFISGDDIRDSIYQVSTRPTGKVNEENISTWLHMHSTQYSEVQYTSYIFWSIAMCWVLFVEPLLTVIASLIRYDPGREDIRM